jgi:hypothetical protein
VSANISPGYLQMIRPGLPLFQYATICNLQSAFLLPILLQVGQDAELADDLPLTTDPAKFLCQASNSRLAAAMRK